MGGQPLLDMAFEDVADVAARRSRGPDTGDRRLARAIMADVLTDLRSEHTQAWIRDERDEAARHLTFGWVADHLGVKEAALRDRLLALAGDATLTFKRRQRGIDTIKAQLPVVEALVAELRSCCGPEAMRCVACATQLASDPLPAIEPEGLIELTALAMPPAYGDDHAA